MTHLRKAGILFLFVTAACTSLAHASGNPVEGAEVAKKCSGCHTFEEGGKQKTGPNLFGIVGKPTGSEPDFRYGPYLETQNEAGTTWDEASLRAWLADSKEVAKAAGTKTRMPAQKIDDDDAENLIAYLKSLQPLVSQQ